MNEVAAMAKIKEFTEDEKQAMKRKGLDWRYYEPVWRGTDNFIVRRVKTQEMQTVSKNPSRF